MARFQGRSEADDPEGEPLLHDPDKSRFDECLLANGIRGVYITYAGEPMAPDIVAIAPVNFVSRQVSP